MKYILSVIAILLLSFSFFWNTYSSIFGTTTEVPYCGNVDECWIDASIDAINGIDANITNKTFSAYIQDVVKYVLSFLMLISVLIIIYAWFNLLVWIWDEEKAKKTKQIIIYAIIWIVIIYLAWPLSDFIFNILDISATTPTP